MNKADKARAKKRKEKLEADFIAKGFKKLDSKLITERPPKIKWGKVYQKYTDKEKIEYLEKLAATMNHAAHLIQEERNQTLDIIEKQEKKIEEMDQAMRDNVDMVQKEIGKMNKERQKFNSSKANLRGEELKERLKVWQSLVE